MTNEKALYETINIAELPLPENIKNMRYQKTLGQFYVKLIDNKPNPLYEQITTYHIDYLDDLLAIELSFQEKDYNKVLSQIKSLILAKEGYVLQGRIYYNLQIIFERHIKETLAEFINPSRFHMSAVTEPNIFEYRPDEEGKSALKKLFPKSVIPRTEEKYRAEFNRFKEILKKWEVNISSSKQDWLEIIFDIIKRDVKTDPLTLVLFHNDLEGQYQIIKITREKDFPFNDFTLFKTDGVNFYLPNDTIYRPVKDFRMAMIIAVIQKKKKE